MSKKVTVWAFSLLLLMASGTMAPSVSALLGTPVPLVEPSPPTDLTATLTTPTSIILNWNESSDILLLPVTGYKIERSTDEGNSWETIVSNTNSASTQYLDEMLSSGTTYTYRVSAINEIGTSEPSNTASATTSSITLNAGFVTFCMGLIQSYGYVNNPVPDHNEVLLQYYAPNNNLVLNRTLTIASGGWYGNSEFGISRDEGKGNYTVIATYDGSLQAEKVFPSIINNDPIIFLVAREWSGDGVIIQARVGSGIGGEEVSVSIIDPNGSTTATYTQATNCKVQFQQIIFSTEVAQVFPTSGNYTITATHVPTGVNSTIMFEYVR